MIIQNLEPDNYHRTVIVQTQYQKIPSSARVFSPLSFLGGEVLLLDTFFIRIVKINLLQSYRVINLPYIIQSPTIMKQAHSKRDTHVEK
jgi:hypothetical protein